MPLLSARLLLFGLLLASPAAAQNGQSKPGSAPTSSEADRDKDEEIKRRKLKEKAAAEAAQKTIDLSRTEEALEKKLPRRNPVKPPLKPGDKIYLGEEESPEGVPLNPRGVVESEDAARLPPKPDVEPAATVRRQRRGWRLLNAIGSVGRAWHKPSQALPATPEQAATEKPAPPSTSSLAPGKRPNASTRAPTPALKPSSTSAPRDPSTPRDNADLALAAVSGFKGSFAELGLAPAPPGAASPAVRADGAPAGADELARLTQFIAQEPRALMRRPDFFEAVSRPDFARVRDAARAGADEPPMRHIGLTDDARDVVRSQSCSGLSGSCNPHAGAASYRRGDYVPPEELTRIAAALDGRRDEPEEVWEDVDGETTSAAAEKPETPGSTFKAFGTAEEEEYRRAMSPAGAPKKSVFRGVSDALARLGRALMGSTSVAGASADARRGAPRDASVAAAAARSGLTDLGADVPAPPAGAPAPAGNEPPPAPARDPRLWVPAAALAAALLYALTKRRR